MALKVAPIQDLVELTNEIAMQAMSVHANIVSYIETFATSSELCIVMEYISGGSLTDAIGIGIDWEEKYIANVCKQMLMALAHVHRQHRIHRDIKSDNILIDPENGAVKIADFGFAIGLTSEAGTRNSVVGKSRANTRMCELGRAGYEQRKQNAMRSGPPVCARAL